MKKILIIGAVLLAAVVTFTFLPKTTEAQKTLIGKGSDVDVERIKQISLDYLRNDRINRAVSAADELKVQSVSLDSLKMAHTKVRQTVNEIPVWEGEAIVHLKADGELSAITDELKTPSASIRSRIFRTTKRLDLPENFTKAQNF